MVFTMHYCKSKFANFLRVIGFMLALMGSLQAAEITQFQTERSDEGVLVSTQVRFDMPLVMEDTLAKGIPLFFVMEGQVVRERWYWIDKKICTSERRIRLAFQPLMRRWRLTISNGAGADSNLGLLLNQSFDSLGQALASLKRVARWNICDANELDAGQRYRVEFKFRLDVNELPRPFQIGALGQSDWDIAASISQTLPMTVVSK